MSTTTLSGLWQSTFSYASCGTWAGTEWTVTNVCGVGAYGWVEGGYSTGWSVVPLGSRIDSLTYSISTCTGTLGSGTAPTGYGQLYYPTSAVAFGPQPIPSASCVSDSGTNTATTVFYTSDQSGTALYRALIEHNESFLTQVHTFVAGASTATLTFTPPPAKVLFFGTM
jgi:hypothetical protein